DHQNPRVVEAARGGEGFGESLARGKLRLALDPQVVRGDRLRGAVTDRRESKQPKRSDVVEDPEELLEEVPDAIAAGEYDPVVLSQLREYIMQGVRVDLPGNGDQREFHDFGPQRGEFAGELGRLLARPRNDDATARK